MAHRLTFRRIALSLSVAALAIGGQAMLAPAAMAAPKKHPKQAEAPAPEVPVKPGAPKLIVAISIDQFSADLFAQYRDHYSYGFARLLKGAVFPSGFQSHAGTETCPGHSTLLTGVHPARTGIVVNTWYDMKAKRADKRIYCVEDENDKDSSPSHPVVSAQHLKVPTLGEYVKKQWPESRNVAVSVKDRAAVMMGGHKIDTAAWYVGDAFTSFKGAALPQAVIDTNARIQTLLKGAPPLDVPKWCEPRDRAVQAGSVTVGTGRFAIDPVNDSRKPGDQLRYSPRADAATLEIAAALLRDMKLGQGKTPDVLSVSLSANDYIGHSYGTEGLEMCIQQAELDKSLGAFFGALDASGVDYAVVLSADHGGIDLPERLREQGLPEAQRAAKELSGATIGKAIAEELGITPPAPGCSPESAGSLVCSEGPFGDYWINPNLSPEMHEKVVASLIARLKANPQVETVFTRAQIAASPYPIGHPQDWTQLQKARASFDPERSGEVYSVLKRAVVGVATPGVGYVSTHGSPWDYDRRVPILFWRKGVPGMEQPQPVETVDIAPTLTALLGVKVPEGAFDGRCLDIDGGPNDTCR